MALATAAALILSAVLLLLFSDPYRFRAEPVRSKQELSLKKTALKDRKPIRPTLCRDRLSDNLALIYDEIDGQLENSVGGSFWLSNASKADFACAWKAYSDDHPEVFWISSETPYSYYEMDGELEIEFNYVLNGEELEGAKNELNKAAEKAFAYAPDNPDDLELEVFINDYLVNHCEYKTGAELCHTSYGALVNGEAVCDGYSRAFQLLCRNAGISCAVIEGTSDFNDDKNVGHMWNLVELGGSWYHLDCTWDDGDDGYMHDFFNMTDTMISRDHVTDPLLSDSTYTDDFSYNFFVPECSSIDMNYFNIEGLIVTEITLETEEQIANLIYNKASAGENNISFMVDGDLSYDEFTSYLLDNSAYKFMVLAERANDYLDDAHKLKTNTCKTYKSESRQTLRIEMYFEQ